MQLGFHVAMAAAAAPIRPLAWEPPYAAGVTLKKKKGIRRSTIEYGKRAEGSNTFLMRLSNSVLVFVLTLSSIPVLWGEL